VLGVHPENLLSSCTTGLSHIWKGQRTKTEDQENEGATQLAVDSDDYGRTDRVYHRTDTAAALPIRQTSRRLP
jgi:hypothetical protein